MLGYIQNRHICSSELELAKILGPTYVYHKLSVVGGHGSSGISWFGNKFAINPQGNLWPYEALKSTNSDIIG